MVITSNQQYESALDTIYNLSGFLSFRNFTSSEAKQYNELLDSLEAYEDKQK
ncbi:hypothetical protein GNP80_08970 [Aliivibrio fischeri]|uniref:hypothetical protein n=1 Tax=Aliivibrio fischeri TaxID=668 RepID=UPI0012D8A369|nr:hypothetical protein [Aliivibrio fischeri]MUK92573.1 hypothetical protein [Aliivibrio fischeri]